jgi:pilus assembly protein CpaC
VLGALFRSTDFQKGETELLIVVTPGWCSRSGPTRSGCRPTGSTTPTSAAAVLLGETYDPVPSSELNGDAAKEDGDYEY